MALGSPNHEQVPDTEINHYINEGQAKLNRHGLMLRKSATTNSAANQERYEMPSDVVSIVRVDYDGKKMKYINYDDILELDIT